MAKAVRINRKKKKEAPQEAQEIDQLLRSDEVSYLTGFTLQRLAELRMVRTGPPFIKLGRVMQSAVRYPKSKLIKWIDEQTQGQEVA